MPNPKLRDILQGQSTEDDGEVLENLKYNNKVRVPLPRALLDDTATVALARFT